MSGHRHRWFYPFSVSIQRLLQPCLSRQLQKLLLAHKSVLLKCVFRYCLGLLVAFPKHLGKTTFRGKKRWTFIYLWFCRFQNRGDRYFFSQWYKQHLVNMPLIFGRLIFFSFVNEIFKKLAKRFWLNCSQHEEYMYFL